MHMTQSYYKSPEMYTFGKVSNILGLLFLQLQNL